MLYERRPRRVGEVMTFTPGTVPKYLRVQSSDIPIRCATSGTRYICSIVDYSMVVGNPLLLVPRWYCLTSFRCGSPRRGRVGSSITIRSTRSTRSIRSTQ